MQYRFEPKRFAYQGREVRSLLAHVSIEGTFSAGAEVFVGGVCKCHLVSCKQFSNTNDAIGAIERKAAQWIDDREAVQV